MNQIKFAILAWKEQSQNFGRPIETSRQSFVLGQNHALGVVYGNDRSSTRAAVLGIDWLIRRGRIWMGLFCCNQMKVGLVQIVILTVNGEPVLICVGQVFHQCYETPPLSGDICDWTWFAQDANSEWWRRFRDFLGIGWGRIDNG